ncbi:hypothetical protein [Vibrio parahaemolyticus]|uniref:hypothetical protein n=1 Tax=Vibrio parahaemolyticus TaxID=670 RepID=UPI0027E55955|nr:hypothetical protein [Vibrio parahaemolyticus]WMN64842.1 hypothetical protein NI388_06655 [Vibrio parahaemolyticus]WMN75480.1 hypothetical protein NI386_14735 [Vibrio parahaemolyticus]
MEILSIVDIWKYLSWLPNFLLKRVFSPERLGDLIYLDVQSRHTPVSANLSDISDYSISFLVINMSPFDVELDRAEVVFHCAGTALKTQYIRKTVFKAGQVGTLYVSDEISRARAEQIAKFYDKNDSRISFHGEFNCDLHNFTKVIHQLEGVNVKYTNAEWRRNQQEVA